MHSKNATGFTLIELLVTTSIAAFIILSVSSLFMVFLLSNARTSTRSFVKSEGSYAMGRIEFLLRNSIELLPTSGAQKLICAPNMPQIAFRSVDGSEGEIFAFDDDGSYKLAVQYTHEPKPQLLTSDGVTIENDQITFSCDESNGKRSVEVTFTLSKESPTVSSNAPPATTETFSSLIFLRN